MRRLNQPREMHERARAFSSESAGGRNLEAAIAINIRQTSRHRRQRRSGCGSAELCRLVLLMLLTAGGCSVLLWPVMEADSPAAQATRSGSSLLHAPSPPGDASQPAAYHARRDSGEPGAASAQEQQDAELAALQRHVAQHGPAGSFFGAGCRWREAPRTGPARDDPRCRLDKPRGALFGGMPSVWRCHRYQYWDERRQKWTEEQPAACRLGAVPLAEWAEGRAALQSGNGTLPDGSPIPVSTWSQRAWQQQQQQQQGQQQAELAAAGAATAAGAADVKRSDRLPAQQHPFSRADVATDVACTPHYCVLRNVWYSNGGFFFLVDEQTPPLPGKQWGLSSRRKNSFLHVRSAADFAASAAARVVPGETVVLEYLFTLHARALGHFQEMLFPLFSILRREPLLRRTPTRLLLLSQQRANLCDWLRGLLAVVLGVQPGKDLPPLLFQQEAAEPSKQARQLLEGAAPGEWLMFEQVLMPRDVFSGGNRGCDDQRDAQLLRALAYAQYGLPVPAVIAAAQPAAQNASAEHAGPGAAQAQDEIPNAALPAVAPVGGAQPPAAQPGRSLRITLQRKSSNRRLVNEGEVVAVLHRFGEVRVVEFGADATFAEQLEATAATDLFVSVHTSNLANAFFLRPGSGVVEILQRNWGWEGIDRFFQSFSAQLGDIHHCALRAQPPTGETYFPHPTLHKLFAKWTAQQCVSGDCVEALTTVDVRVEPHALQELLEKLVPLIQAGANAAESALPWPHIPTGRPGGTQAAGAQRQTQHEKGQEQAGEGSKAPPGGLAKWLFERSKVPPRQLAQRLFVAHPGTHGI